MILGIAGWLLLQAAIWQVHTSLGETVILKTRPASAPSMTGSAHVATISCIGCQWLLLYFGLITELSDLV